ncbi:hypothetical protein [Phenylobacterium aquaticum]|uniref:hypothetical protein n=1 Tax=Phenylobacterium aquaticum TaxID=1763816 RepID=UPI001F5C3E4E|nr:hypothetical protein [Phenylobacterium aquaticum]MCI3135118.1 hypothetical protein [Phenylobacterium aquaticum]
MTEPEILQQPAGVSFARRTVVIGALILQSVFLVALGVAIAGPVRDTLERRASGSNLTCVSPQRLCVGQSIDSVDVGRFESELGGLIDVTCGFNHPGALGGNAPISIGALISGGCATDRYVLTFSDGRLRTSLWIDHRRIARVDRSPRHVIDL